MATKVIKGTKDVKGYVVIKGQADTRQLRCKHCGGLAIQVPDGQGGHIYQCQGCQKKYTVQSL